MTESVEWPSQKNSLTDGEHLKAIGQFALLFNFTEDILRDLFQGTFHSKYEYSEYLFDKLGNRDRVDMLRAIILFDEKDSEVSDRLLTVLRYFNICCDNRNIVLHAVTAFDGGAASNALHLVKRARNNPAQINYYDLSLEEIRRVADDTAATFLFMTAMWSWLFDREAGCPASPLPGIPPQPCRLSPSPPAAANASETPQPQPSGK
jgi:hypothetical protein